MTRIPLVSGDYTMVDDDDAELAGSYRWSSLLVHTCKYACTHSNGRTLYLHRLLLKPGSGEVVDHINGDGLDNCRSNLRICTRQQNQCNQRKRKDNKTGYKGVFKHSQYNKYCAQIQVAGRGKHLGVFSTPEEAYAAYCAASAKYHGEFGRVV